MQKKGESALLSGHALLGIIVGVLVLIALVAFTMPFLDSVRTKTCNNDGALHTFTKAIDTLEDGTRTVAVYHEAGCRIGSHGQQGDPVISEGKWARRMNEGGGVWLCLQYLEDYTTLKEGTQWKMVLQECERLNGVNEINSGEHFTTWEKKDPQGSTRLTSINPYRQQIFYEISKEGKNLKIEQIWYEPTEEEPEEPGALFDSEA